ncbi:hypothetical protein PB2503_01487 [Parvularcula bermudensis HTCC2503]|uniref:Uncharacterized protein n=1 Tax=Parvularcula bermudensis (strain ATCC BAA-594 / HTCC2503 / KCTC 12087) TaxID=314260 RepID=E0TBK1_PARBH|nr:hypothetical protein [Parvularcula bermudensis]ADM08376.1 hypothetical protein PB2503_01487 [Parvularcula bermudensis HTCC2503]
MRLRRLIGLTVGAVAVSGTAVAEDRPYEVLAATLDGRVTMAIVDRQGAAIAIEIGDDRPEIIQGLAAGAILSDLREIVSGEGDRQYTVSSGIASSVVRLNGDIQTGRATPAEAARLIDDLPGLTITQKGQLKAILSL